MSGMPHTNPVAIAKETVAIAKESGSPTFEKAAKWTLIASAAVTAVIGILHAARTIARDISKGMTGHDHARSHTEPVPKAAPPAIEEPPPVAKHGRQEQSWVSRARADRPHEKQRQAHGGR